MIVAGLDVGSRTSKAVIMEGGEIRASFIGDTILKDSAGVSVALTRVLEKANLRHSDLQYVMATGYGRFQIDTGHEHISEISCHARGVHWYFPSVRTILDIGGQDSKAINCNDRGRITNFVLNNKCAGGTGRFLEVIADILNIPVEDFGDVSLQSTKKLSFSTVCVIFAKTEALNMLRNGVPKPDIINGLHNSIASVGLTMLKRISLKKDLSVTGGVAKNGGVVRKIEEISGMKTLVAPDPQLIGAIGAALFSRDRLLMKSKK